MPCVCRGCRIRNRGLSRLPWRTSVPPWPTPWLEAPALLVVGDVVHFWKQLHEGSMEPG